MVRQLRENGCPWAATACTAAAGGKSHLSPLPAPSHHHPPTHTTHIATSVCTGGHLALLEWLQEQGCPCKPAAGLAAAGGGHLHVLEPACHDESQLTPLWLVVT